MIASPHRLDFTPQQQLVSRSQKETSRVSESEDDVMMNGNEFDKTNEYEDEAEDFRPDGTVLEPLQCEAGVQDSWGTGGGGSESFGG